MPPAHDLGRLIANYRSLREELSSPHRAHDRAGLAHIRDALDDVLLCIATFPSGNANVSICQIDFLLAAIPEARHDAQALTALTETVRNKVMRLASDAASQRPHCDPAQEAGVG